jgi:hypothetical protein
MIKTAPILISFLVLVSKPFQLILSFKNCKILILSALIILFYSFNFSCKAQEIRGAEKYDTSLIYVHSPKKASFYSAVVPGLGQIYNGKWWKVPIIYAGAATIGYYISFNNKKYVEYKTNYLIKVNNDTNEPFTDSKFVNASEENIKNYMNYWRRNRDLLVLGMAALYLANIVDATVDAYLFDYDISQDLSMKIQPTLMNSPESINFGVSCSFRF